MDNHKKVAEVIYTLKNLYPNAALALNYSNAFELLIAVILSAQCTDERVNRVTDKLFKKYKSPQDFLKVSRSELEADIRPTGFYRNKAKSLVACCRMLIDQFNGNVPQKIDHLVKLPGVGRKTAAMVIGNAYKENQGIAVDTHVKRVVQRLQLTSENSVDKIERDLMNLVDPEQWTWFSNTMILFGRIICTSRSPKCTECPFNDWCPSPDKVI